MIFPNSIQLGAFRARFDRNELARLWAGRPSLLFSACAAALIAAMLLGGGTRAGFLSDTILELIAIPAFLMSLSSLITLPWSQKNRGAEWALILCLAVAVLPLIQLVPLPPWIWTRLPERDQIVVIFDLLHQDLPWMPISVSPSLTWASVLSLIPPLAIFLGVIQLGYRERRLMSLIMLALGILSAFLGLLQIAQGPSSPWRFFAYTNDNDAVGFFANRNHLAALLYSILLFGSAWAINVAFSIGSWKERQGFETGSIVILTASLLALVVLITAEASTRSRAGVGLLIVALFAIFALAMTDRRRSTTTRPVKLIIGSLIVAMVLIVQFALYRVLARFEDPLEGARIEFAQNTIHAAEAYMPFGSGFGTFVTVYPSFEPPQDALDNKYVNHAHDDLLEVWLEGGAMTVMLMTAFLFWLFLTARRAWRGDLRDARSVDVLLARAATIVIALIIVHSAVDYPLRTDAMMALLALACALLVEPLQFAPQEIEARLPPATEISDEEKRRLAVLRGEAVSDYAPELLNAPTPAVLEHQHEAPGESRAVVGAPDENLPQISYEAPMDLDEAAGLVEADMHPFDPALKEIADDRSPALREADQEPLSSSAAAAPQDLGMSSATYGQPMAPQDSEGLPVPSEQPEPVRSVPVSSEQPEPVHSVQSNVSAEADPESGRVGDMAYTLAQFNRLSAVLIERSEVAATKDVEPTATDEIQVPPGAQLAEAAQRRMKILHSLKFVQRPGDSTATDSLHAPPETNVRTEAPGPAEASLVEQNHAHRRMRELRSVERFIQSAGLTPETVEEPARTGEPIEPDQSRPAAVETAIPLEAAEVVPSPIAAGEPETAPAPLEAPEQLYQVAEDEAVVEPIIGKEVFAELAEPVPDSHPFARAAEAWEEPPTAEDIHPLPQTPEPQEQSPQEQPSQDQWGAKIEWPQQWRGDVAVDSMADKSDIGHKAGNAEPSGAPTVPSEDVASTPENNVLPVPVVAKAAREPTAAAAKASVPVPAAKPRAAQKTPAGAVESPALPTKARWGDDVEWPEEWRK